MPSPARRRRRRRRPLFRSWVFPSPPATRCRNAGAWHEGASVTYLHAPNGTSAVKIGKDSFVTRPTRFHLRFPVHARAVPSHCGPILARSSWSSMPWPSQATLKHYEAMLPLASWLRWPSTYATALGLAARLDATTRHIATLV